MRKSLVAGSRLLALVSAAALLSAPALARDVTVYGGGKSKTYQAEDTRNVRVIAYGQDRETAQDKRVKRFATERKVQSILDKRDTEDARETSDAMMRIILTDHDDARHQYSRYFPYHARSAEFYAQLERKMEERNAGVRVYRQSILDNTSNDDLERVAKAMDDIE